ncbi:MAG: thioesterase family protein [Trueperaceae bacterium]
MSGNESTNAYFVRESGSRFRPTDHVGGGWDPNEQHIAPSIGLLAHVIESDFAARRPHDDLRLNRLSCDILGVMPLEPVDVSVSVLRPGRTIELVEARLSHNGRDAAVARAWLSARYDTAALAGSGFSAMPPLSAMQQWGLHKTWPGGFVKSTQIWRDQQATGRVRFWLRSDVALLENEQVSPTAHLLRLIDVANGVASRVPPGEVAFPNLDLTAHLFRQPTGELTGLDTTASFGPDGAGLTQSVLHDEHGPIGTFAQTLTVRPK